MQPHDQEQLNFKYRFGSFELDPQDTTHLRFLKGGQPCKIQQKQFDLLVCLIRRHGQPLSYDELLLEVWNDRPSSNARVIESRVQKLQKQVSLLGKATDKSMIRAQKGYYCFITPVIELPSRREPVGAFEELTFQWIINARETRGFKLFLGGFISFSILYLFALGLGIQIPYLSGRGDSRLVLSVIQFIVIAYAFLVSLSVFKQVEKVFPQAPLKDRELMEVCGYADLHQWTDAKQSANDSLKQYLSYWRLLVAAWTLLYLILIVRYAGLSEDAIRVTKIISTVFDNVNSLAIALCFVVLDQPTIFKTDGSATDLSRMTRRLKIYGIVVIAIFAVVQVAMLVLNSTGGASEHAVKVVFGWLDLSAGFIGTITLALLVGRLQSKFLGPSAWLPMALYFYVSLPLLYVAAGKLTNSVWEALILEFALILKCLLFLYVIWLVKSGRFLFYFVRAKKLYERVNPDWKTFFLNLEKQVKS